MIDQVSAWREVATKLGITVDAPCEVRLPDGTTVRATAHVKDFGARHGMIVDPDFTIIQPYADLLGDDFGFSAVTISRDTESLMEMLADWGWSGSGTAPTWLFAYRAE